ncbi:MAG: hypothetical protein ACLQAT_25250 [Candidatus Binataceae bacterium]
MPSATIGVILTIVLGHAPEALASGSFRSSISSAFADPQHRVVVAIVFNGMLDASAAKHDARITAVLNAVYEELGVA